MDETVSKSLPFLTLCIFNKVIIFTHAVSPISLHHSFLWLTQNNKLVNCKQIWSGTCWGIWYHQVGHRLYFYLASGPSSYIFAPVSEVELPKMVRDLKVYFYLLAESVSKVIKVLSFLLETPKRKEITGTDLGIERKWDKECNHHTSEWFSDWHLYIKNM